MRRLLLAAALTIGLAAPASADVQTRVYREAEMGRDFWAARSVTGCEGGFQIEIVNDPTLAAGQGGFCRVRMNLYWMRPNPWGMDSEQECALVFHEVKHALPGGTTGGIDGQGHTADGLMATEVRAMPRECLRKVRRAARIGPPKGVFR